MNKTRRVVLRYWVPVFLWMVVISVLSSIPGEELPKIEIQYIDKVIHFLEFLILGVLLIRAISNSGLYLSLPRLFILAFVIAGLYAAVDEWHQHFISNRFPELLDFLSDLLGSSIGIFIYNKRG